VVASGVIEATLHWRLHLNQKFLAATAIIFAGSAMALAHCRTISSGRLQCAKEQMLLRVIFAQSEMIRRRTQGDHDEYRRRN